MNTAPVYSADTCLVQPWGSHAQYNTRVYGPTQWDSHEIQSVLGLAQPILLEIAGVLRVVQFLGTTQKSVNGRSFAALQQLQNSTAYFCYNLLVNYNIFII